MKIKISDKWFFIVSFIVSNVWLVNTTELTGNDKELMFIAILVIFVLGYGSYADRERPSDENFQGFKKL